VTEPRVKSKGSTVPKRRNDGDTFTPSFTLDEYEVKEVSMGTAAKLLKKSKKRRSKSRTAKAVGSEEKQPAKSVPEWDTPDSQDIRYEVEEIDPENLPSWMSDKTSREQSSGKG